MMVLNDCLAIWFANIFGPENPEGDILACVQKKTPSCQEHELFDDTCQDCNAIKLFTEALTNPPPVQFQAVYRFRWYDPKDPRNDAFSGKDRKSWYSIKTESKEDAFKAINALITGLKQLGIRDVWDIQRGEDESFESFLERFKQAPFVHMKVMSKEEAKAQGYNL